MLKHTLIALAAMGAGLAGLASGAAAMPVQNAPALDGARSTLPPDVNSR